jgi:putative DNA primase/helicase
MVHPVGQDKKPLTKWSQSATNDEEAVRRLWREFPDALVGIVTGKKSDLYVVDVDRPEALADAGFNLAGSLAIPSRREGGLHYYYAGPADGKPVKNVAKNGLDFRGDGGYVVFWADEVPRASLWTLPVPIAEWARGGTQDGTDRVAAPVDEVISEGGRESAMVSLAGSMRRRGMSETAILAALREENQAKCRPPLGDDDLQRIAGSVMRYEADGVPRGNALLNALQAFHESGTKEAPKAKPTSSDDSQFGLALEAAGKLRHRAKWRDDEKTWWMCSQNSKPGIWSRQRERGVKQALNQVLVEKKPDMTAAFRNGVEEFMRDLLAVDPSKFDRHPWQLGVVGGVVDLSTGTLSGPDPDLLLTRAAPVRYDPASKCPNWLAHLTRLFEDDSERVDWFQRAVGSALVGDATAKDQSFVVVLGDPGNGKGTVMRTLLHTLGQDQHAASINPGDLTGRERHLAWMHRLRGVRLAIVEELKNSKLDVAKIKTLTGGDNITANRMRQEDETWVPTHTLFMTTNHPPNFGNDTTGLHRRYRPIKTGPSLERSQMSPDYEARLREEADGILTWAIEGCLLWQAEGRRLPTLSVIDELAATHLADNDWRLEWSEGRIAFGVEKVRTSRKRLILNANHWLAERGLPNLDRGEITELYNWLREKGVKEVKSNGEYFFDELALLAGPG